jgi:BirA family biotin operon repressor/biotin-[acetyl-CoA-carboxylase] ligase
MSVLLRPRPSVRLSLIPLAAGVAVKEALAANGVEARLKWPNDVLVGGRKVAGVLGEGIASGPGVQSVVLGVGINVADDGSLPDELRELATSLDAERHAATPLAGLAAAVLVRLRACYSVLAVAPGDVLAAWRQSALPWWGRMVEVDAGVERIAGLARGVDERGALLLELADGAVVPVLAGEARELRPR